MKIPNTYEEWKKLSKEEKLRLWYVTPTSWFGEYQAELICELETIVSKLKKED